MPFLTRSLILYNGSDLTPSNDYTNDTDWPQTELSTMAADGEASAAQWWLRDETGVIPDQAGTKFVSGHNVVIVTVGSNTLFRGRVAENEAFRGRQKVARAREVTVTLEDQNSHLRGINVHNFVRPAETDAARAQGLVAAYLSGSPRATTNLNGSNLIVTSSNTVTLPAKTYSGVSPFEIMQELAQTTDKEFFVSIDNELAYFGHDYTGYDSPIRISDDPADANSNTYAPWDPRQRVVSRVELSALRSYYGTDTTQSSVRVTNNSATYQDYWEEPFWDSESVTAAEASARAAAMLAVREIAEQSFTCAIGPMSGDEVWKLKPGQRVQFKARAARAGRNPNGTFSGDTFGNPRIRELRWTMPAEDQYIAHLNLERQNRIRPPSKGDKALATQPKPNPSAPPTSTSDTLLKFYDANDGGDDIQWVGILANQAGGAEGSAFYYFKSLAPNNFQTSFAATAGTTYRFVGYTHMAAGNRIGIGWRNDAAGSTGNIAESNPVIIRVDTLASGATSKWTLFEQTLTAPAGTTSASLVRRDTWADFDRIRIYQVAAANVGTPSDNTVPQTNYGQLPGPGSDINHYALADHTHGTPPLPPRTVIDILTNNSGSNIDWGDVVKVDSSGDQFFTTNTTLNFSAGWLGVAQAPIGSNATGPVLLQGYAPVINVGSNSTTRGHFLFGSNMARRAYGSATRTTGAFGQVLTTSVAPDAIIWGTTDGSAGGDVASDAIWDAAGDLAVGTGANTAARLAIGASNTHLISDGVTASWVSNTFGAVDAVSAKASGTGDVTITGSLQDLTGATLSLEAGTYIVFGTFDVIVNNALNDRTFEGHLDSSGSDQNDVAILLAGTLANDRWTVSQSWRLVLTSTTTVKLRGKYSGGTAGDFTAKGDNTTISAFRAGGGTSSGAPIHVAPLAGMSHSAFATVGASNNALFSPIYVPGSCTATGVRVNIGTSSGNISAALYTSAGARVATTGAIASPGTGLRTLTFSASYAASAGGYYIGLSADNNTVTFSGHPGTTNQMPGNGFSMATAHPCPDPLTTGGELGNNSNAPNVILVVSGGWP